MERPSNCPHCNAPLMKLDKGFVTYECGTGTGAKNHPNLWFRTITCKFKEPISNMSQEQQPKEETNRRFNI